DVVLSGTGVGRVHDLAVPVIAGVIPHVDVAHVLPAGPGVREPVAAVGARGIADKADPVHRPDFAGWLNIEKGPSDVADVVMVDRHVLGAADGDSLSAVPFETRVLHRDIPAGAEDSLGRVGGVAGQEVS